MRIDLTEVESLEIINVHLKEKLAEQQLSFERERKEILFKRIIEKYGIKGRADLSADGKALILPDTPPVPNDIEKSSQEVEPPKSKKVKKND